MNHWLQSLAEFGATGLRAAALPLALSGATGLSCHAPGPEPKHAGSVQIHPPPTEPAARLDKPKAHTHCTDDHEPDDEPNTNDTARRMAAGTAEAVQLVACPGDVDYIQALGDYYFRARVTWEPADYKLDVTLVDARDQPYEFRPGRRDVEEGIREAPGRIEILGGNQRMFVRVRNPSSSPIPYRIEMLGIWGE